MCKKCWPVLEVSINICSVLEGFYECCTVSVQRIVSFLLIELLRTVRSMDDCVLYEDYESFQLLRVSRSVFPVLKVVFFYYC